MKRTMKRAIGSALIFLLAVTQLCFANMGLQVEPQQINVMNVPLGRKVAVSSLTEQPVYLQINNTSNMALYYEINILPTAQSAYLLIESYTDIPDATWILPRENEIRIEAHQTKNVELYLNIPNKMDYADKRYQAVIEVKSKKNNPQEIFVLACQVRICLQTEKQNGRQSPFRRWLEWIKKNIW